MPGPAVGHDLITVASDYVLDRVLIESWRCFHGDLTDDEAMLVRKKSSNLRANFEGESNEQWSKHLIGISFMGCNSDKGLKGFPS